MGESTLMGQDTERADPGPAKRRPPITDTLARWLGLILFLPVGWLYLVSGLVAPFWAVLVLWAIWLVILAGIIKAWRTRPWLVLAAPFLAFLIWAGILWIGDQLLGWTA